MEDKQVIFTMKDLQRYVDEHNALASELAKLNERAAELNPKIVGLRGIINEISARMNAAEPAKE